MICDAPLTTTGCSWPVQYVSCGARPPWEKSGSPGEQSTSRTLFEQAAIDLLSAWTGNRFGICETTVRPCRSDCTGGRIWASTFYGRGPYPWVGRLAPSPWVPVLLAGQWYNLGCACGGQCSCAETGPAAIQLPGPVSGISSVQVDGRVLASTEYRLQGDILIRTDGTPWPTCQNLLAAPGQPGTFAITYQRGEPVPVGGQLAAGRLACELAMAACNDDDCALPERIQTISRQGMTATFLVTGEKWRETGIWIIDSWVSSIAEVPRSRPAVRIPGAPARTAARW